MKFYLNGDKISKARALELFGKERLNRMIAEAHAAYRQDPNEEISWYTEYKMFVIEF